MQIAGNRGAARLVAIDDGEPVGWEQRRRWWLLLAVPPDGERARLVTDDLPDEVVGLAVTIR